MFKGQRFGDCGDQAPGRRPHKQPGLQFCRAAHMEQTLCVSLVKAAHTPFRSVALLPRNVPGFQAGRGFSIKARGGILV